MKKIVFFLLGILVLTACGEDTVQDQSGSSFKNLNPYDDGSSAPMTPLTSVLDYESPWIDISNQTPVWHYHECNLLGLYGIFVRITPYIGLAYFDGIVDGTYNTPTGSFNLMSGAYPNLIGEYGSYIAANPIVLGINAHCTHELAVIPSNHCAVVDAMAYAYNPDGIYFDLQNNDIVQPAASIYGFAPIVPPPPAATPQETDLLKDYGKVMYYKIEAGPGPNNYLDTGYVLALGDQSGVATPIIPSFVDMFGGEVLYHNSPISPSQEIVIDPASPSFISGNIPLGIDFTRPGGSEGLF